MSNRSPGVRYPVSLALLFALGLLILLQVPFHNGAGWKLRGGAVEPRPHPDLRIAAAYGKLPLQFELNRGQTDPQVQFLSRGSGYTLFLAAGEAVLQLRNADPGLRNAPGQKARNPKSEIRNPQSTVVRLKLVGANPAPLVAGQEELPGRVNYFIGNDPAKWRTNVPTYARVKYREVYRGVDLVYYGNQRQLEHDFVVAPGADPKQIRMAVEGAERVELDAGDLVLHAAGGDVRLRAPVAYQEMDGRRRAVAASYVLHEGNPQSEIRNPQSDAPHSALGTPHLQEVGFEVAAYDPTRPLVIDPVLVYSTYLGGSGYLYDYGCGIAVDSSGSAYVTGYTTSTNFPTASPLQATIGGGAYDAFVTKLNAAGSALVYSTYLGGNNDDYGFGIAVDSSGNAYVTGYTYSPNFPTASPLQGTFAGRSDAFVTKLNAAGSALVYSTYLGGSEHDAGNGIVVDSGGNAYVTGYTYSTNFPTAGPLQSTSGGGSYDAFVTKLNAAGSALVYSTYLGGSGDDCGKGIAVDSSGSAYVAGYTGSTNFPTASPLQATHGGGSWDAFVAKLNAAGSALVYSTYLGGSGYDDLWGLAVDSSGAAYVAGWTASSNFPTASPLQATYGGGAHDAFVTKLNPAGSALVYSTYLGGSGDDCGRGIALDASGSAYVTGQTTSTNFPTASPLQAISGGGSDAFVAELNAAGSALVYSTYLGGSGDDVAYAVAVDSSGNAYLTGITISTNFPTAAPLQAANGGYYDAFVAKIGLPGNDLALTKTGPASVSSGSNIAYTLTVTNNGPAAATGVTLTDPLPTNVTFVSATPSTGTCLPSTAVTCNLGSLANGASATVTLVVQPTANGTVTNTASVTANESDPVTSNNSATVTTVTGDFTLAVSPASQLVLAGGSASYTVTITGSGGFASSVNLSCSGLPAGASCSFLPNPASAGTSTLNIATSGVTPTGTSTVTVNGTSGSLSHSATSSLTVSVCSRTYAGSGAWETAASWSPAGLPASTDIACINSGSAVTLASSPTIAALLLGGTLSINSGTLTVASTTTASVASGSAVLNLNAGTLSLAGSLTVQSGGTFNWTGGTISGAGSASIAPGAALNISGTADKTFNTGTINNAGTATWSDSGRVMGYYGGTFNNQAGGLFDARNDSSFYNNYSGAPTFNNNAGATFRKSAGTGTTQFSGAPFNNNGTLAVLSGTVTLSSGGTSTGTFTVAAPAALMFDGGTHDLNAGYAIAGAGAVNFAGATMNFNGAGTVASATLSAGTLGGSAHVTVSGALNWTGGTITGSGAVDIAAGAALNISGTAEKTFNTGTINNAGTATWSDSGRIGGYYGGTFNNQAGGLFDARNDSSFYNNYAGAPTFNNNAGATFRKSAGTGATQFSGAPFNNNGTLAVQSGTVALSSGGTSTGTFTVASPAVLTFDGGTHDLNAGYAIAGAGAVNFAGATMNFNGAGTVASATLSAGTLGGSAHVTVSGALNWTGGTITGSGAVDIAAGAALNISGTAEKTFNTGTINNAGTATWSDSGRIGGYYGGTFNNQAGGLFDARNDSSFYNNYAGAPTFNNNAGATFRKSAGTGATQFSGAPFNNSGTVDVRSGTVNFTSTYIQTAGATVLNGGGITIESGTLSINGGSLGGAGTVTGNVSNAGAINPGASAGTLVITGNYTQTSTGALNVELGSASSFDVLQVGGTATLAGTLNITRLSGYVPPAGSSFPVLTYASRSGSFTTTNGLDTGGGLTFQPAFGTTAFALNVGSNPAPSVALLAPASGLAGGAGFTLAVTGTNFTATSVVRWNGSDRTTAFVSATQLTATITAADIALAGTAQVTVFNPAPGGGTSSPLAFTIISTGNPVPTLTALSPDNKTAGGPGFTLTVTGVNFVPGATVLWNSSPRVTTFVSSTQLTAEITVFDLANAGTAQVTVTNPAPGGGPSATGLPFTIYPRGSYLVGDAAPFSGYEAGKFGDDAIDNPDLIVALRAVTSVPGFIPPNCSDLYDAMDAHPVDGSGRGGDGMLDNLDLIATLRRVTNADPSRARRQTRGLVCSAEAPPSQPVLMALAAESAAAGDLEFGSPEPAGIPIYLRAARELNLSALSFSLGQSGGAAARGKLGFVAADAGAPTLLDDALAGTLAMAWLDGMQLAAGQRLSLGFVELPETGTSRFSPLAIYGAKANDRDGVLVRIAFGGSRDDR